MLLTLVLQILGTGFESATVETGSNGNLSRKAPRV